MKQIQNIIVRTAQAALVGLLLASPMAATVSAETNTQLQRQFWEASQEFHVPVELLLSISYNQSRWEDHAGQASMSGGYGLMHLTAPRQTEDMRGDQARPLSTQNTATNTLGEAATLIGAKSDVLKTDNQQNLRGGAALLARYEQELQGGQTPASIDEWYGAVAKMSSATSTDGATRFADSVYDTIQSGVSRTTAKGQRVSLQAKKVSPARKQVEKLKLSQPLPINEATECPTTIHCTFVPARYAQNNPDDPTDYGNYDPANRPQDLQIKYIVIHDTEGSYQSAIDWFQDPRSYTSAHYVIRSSDGDVTQMVPTKDVAWQAGNWYMNTHSIGIEHEGYWNEGGTWYTEAMYQSSAQLVRYLAAKYNIPLDREHIIGHEEVPALRTRNVQGMHPDPGPYWDWEHYMRLLGAEDTDAAEESLQPPKVVSIVPHFKQNKIAATTCSAGTCTPLPVQNSSQIYLRTEPNESAPLLKDAGMHPDGSNGTTDITDTSAKAVYGRKYVVADRQKGWIAIWFNGQKGWFPERTPDGGRTTIPAHAPTLTPKNGQGSVQLYGAAYPETSAYPTTIPQQAPTLLPYAITAGQSYVTYDGGTPTDYYYSWSYNHTIPNDGTIVIGNEKYLPVVYAHRIAFVKAADVDISY